MCMSLVMCSFYRTADQAHLSTLSICLLHGLSKSQSHLKERSDCFNHSDWLDILLIHVGIYLIHVGIYLVHVGIYKYIRFTWLHVGIFCIHQGVGIIKSEMAASLCQAINHTAAGFALAI